MTKRFLFVCAVTLLVSCGQVSGPDGVIAGSGSAVGEAFGGSPTLDAAEEQCIASRPELGAVLEKYRDDATGFQVAVFERNDLKLSQQVLDCFGERWSNVVRQGSTDAVSDCRARVFQQILRSAVDGGNAELRAVETASETMERVVGECSGNATTTVL